MTKTTQTNYCSTVNVEQIKTDVLKDMVENILRKIRDLWDEVDLIEEELNRRRNEV